jgi:hypothetical protein
MSTNTTTVPSEKKDALADRLEAAGFVVSRPQHVSPESIAIDRQVAAETTCGECNHVGLEFLPFRAPGVYRGMAWCCVCCAAIEM